MHMLERRHIERMGELDIGKNLADAEEKFCSRAGPSVPREVFEKLRPQRVCGSQIPMSR